MRGIIGLLILCLCFVANGARATEADIYCQTGTNGTTGYAIFLPASATNPCPVTSSGGGGGGTSSAYGSAFPTDGTALGLTDGAIMRALTGINYTGTSYAAAVDLVTAIPAGTAVIGKFGIDQTTPGTTNGVVINNSSAISVTDTGDYAQGSTTSGQVGPLVQGSVTSAVPTYTTAQTSPLNLTTSGALRVVMQNGASAANPLVMNTAASGTGTAGLGAVGIYLSTAPAMTTGQVIGLQLDASGNLMVSGRPITPVVSAAGENAHVLKASAGNLFSVYATNLTATSGFLVVLNSTTAPADGAITPLACAPLPASGVASLSYNPGPPAAYSTGITAVVTSATTCFTKTTGTITAFISGSVQ